MINFVNFLFGHSADTFHRIIKLFYPYFFKVKVDLQWLIFYFCTLFLLCTKILCSQKIKVLIWELEIFCFNPTIYFYAQFNLNYLISMFTP